jgi:hypothetical protein
MKRIFAANSWSDMIVGVTRYWGLILKQGVQRLLKIDVAPVKQVIACMALRYDANELRRCICQSQRNARGPASCINKQPQLAGARMFHAPIESAFSSTWLIVRSHRQ